MAAWASRRRLRRSFCVSADCREGINHNADVPSRETLDALTSDEFLMGLVFGLIALTLGVLVVYVWRRWSDTPAPVVAVLLTGAATAAMQTTRELPSDLWVGVLLLALGGALYPWARSLPMLPAVVAIPGAWWVTRVVDLPGAVWVPWLLFAWIVVGAPLVTSFDRHFADRGYGPVLLVIGIAGMFATLPDTEEILVLFGAAVPLAILAWPKVVASLGAVGVYPLLGVFAWVIAFGGRGRESAVIGAVACLGLLAVEPLVRWLRNQTLLDRFPTKWSWVPVVAGMQLVIVLLAARVAGLSRTPQRAGLIAGLVLSGAAAFLAVSDSRSPARLWEHGAHRKRAGRQS